MNINELVAKRIKAVRKSKNLTAEKLAWTANLSKSCVSYAEKAITVLKYLQLMQCVMLWI